MMAHQLSLSQTSSSPGSCCSNKNQTPTAAPSSQVRQSILFNSNGDDVGFSLENNTQQKSTEDNTKYVEGFLAFQACPRLPGDSLIKSRERVYYKSSIYYVAIEKIVAAFQCFRVNMYTVLLAVCSVV